MASMCL
jgi:hypothetical protein